MSLPEVTDGEALARAREALATSLVEPGTLAGIVEEIVAALASAFPGYATLARVAPEDVRASVGQHVRTILGCLGQARLPRPDELAVLSAVAGRRQEQGVPLDQLLRGHTFGANMLVDRALEKLRGLSLHEPAREAIADDARRIIVSGSKMVADAFCAWYARADAAAADHANEQALAVALAGAQGAKSLLRAAGFAVGRFHTVAAFGAMDPACREIEPHAMLVALQEILPREPSILMAPHGSSVVVLQAHEHAAAAARLAALVREATVSDRLPSCVLAGIGRPAERVAGILASYQDAAEVLELLRAMPAPPRAMEFEEAVPFLMLPQCAEAGLAAVRSLLRDPEQRRIDLETLDAYFGAGFVAAAAARALDLQDKTVLRRIESIERRTGRSFDIERDRELLNAGRRALRLFPDGNASGSTASTGFACPSPRGCPTCGQNSAPSVLFPT